MSQRALLSTRKGLFILERAGQAWTITQRQFLGVSVLNAFADPRDGAIYAALDHGHFGPKLHRSDDGGATFPEITTPAFPEKPANEPDWINPMSNAPIPWKVAKVWTLEPGGPDQRDRVWAGTLPGGLFTSTDRGESWKLVRSLWDRPERAKWFGGGFDLPGIHSICVDPRSSNRVTIGVSCGGAWVTEDCGESWHCRSKGMFAEYMPPEQREVPEIQDPHLVAQCLGDPDKMWIQHHNGVFRTVDGAKQWTHIPGEGAPSTFGFAVAVHPKDGDTAWFVPGVKDECRIPVDGKLVVTRTRDGGKSFEVLRKGLPQDDAYDIVFRHALAIDPAGETLMFGSTTGGVWWSDDQGDSWQTFSTHLPPVHAVRFA